MDVDREWSAGSIGAVARAAAEAERDAVLGLLLGAARRAETDQERGWLATIHRLIELGLHHGETGSGDRSSDPEVDPVDTRLQDEVGRSGETRAKADSSKAVPTNTPPSTPGEGTAVGTTDLDRVAWGVVHNAGRRGGYAPRWLHVMHMTGLGSTSASALCVRFGTDPDEMVGKECLHCDGAGVEDCECSGHGGEDCECSGSGSIPCQVCGGEVPCG